MRFRESDVFTAIILTTLCDRHQEPHWSWDGHCAMFYILGSIIYNILILLLSPLLILPYITQCCSGSVHLKSMKDKKIKFLRYQKELIRNVVARDSSSHQCLIKSILWRWKVTVDSIVLYHNKLQAFLFFIWWHKL